jgi:hypothetical protein
MISTLAASAAIKPTLKQSPFLAFPSVVRCHDGTVLDHQQGAFQPSSPLAFLLALVHECLNILGSDEISSPDFSPDGGDKFNVIASDAPLGHSHNRMWCELQIAHG